MTALAVYSRTRPPAEPFRYPTGTNRSTTPWLTRMAPLQVAVSGRLPEQRLEAVLNRAGFASSVARWVDEHIRPGPYTHYTVSLHCRGSQTVLCIDTFLLDPWINSTTGETGESPHGSCEEFVIDSDGNVVEMVETLNDDGSICHSFSSSVTFYGG